jgi:hypothetical protein
MKKTMLTTTKRKTKTRREPREVSQSALDMAIEASWDHLGSGTVAPRICPWNARGMRCDCLACLSMPD